MAIPPRPIGPTVPRWRLGALLADLRDDAGVSMEETAKELGCSTHKLRKIFGGQVSVAKQELRAMVELYGVTDDDLRAYLEELQTLGKQRAWWSGYTRYIGPTYATFIGFEYAAITVRNWQPVIVPGLLQTAAYTGALGRADDLNANETTRYVELRMLRQEHVWTDDPPDAHFVVDESVLYRAVGGREVMREQLARLLDPPAGSTVQVVPLSRAEHPGTAGSLSVFEYPKGLHRPVAWLEGYVGLMRLEQEPKVVQGCTLAVNHVLAAALSVGDSRQMIRGVLDELYRPSGGNT